MATAKETLYIEADDEITTIIDKIVSSKHKVVAAVLPKHAAVFQSAVNMKLVKKAASDANKNLVLITSDSAIKMIAGAAGMHIAKTLTSKPEVPKKPKTNVSETTITAEQMASNKIPEIEPEQLPTNDKEETIEIDNTKVLDKETGKKVSQDKKLKFKIPDFSSFRLKMGLAITAVILLVVGWFFGFVVLPEATVTINSDTSRIDVSTDFIVKDGLEQVDLENGIIPSVKVEVDKEDSVTVPATGEKNIGEKASGVITLTNCIKSGSGIDVPAGSAFSVGSYTFVTTEVVELGPAVYVGNSCISADFPAFGAIKDTTVVATQPGEGYNLDSRAYTSSISGVSAFGSDMSGGTTQLATVVSQEDIDNATDQLAGSSTADAVEELKASLSGQQLQPLVETLQESEAKVVRSAAVDTEVSELTVTRTVKYSMSGVRSEYLSGLLNEKIKEDLEDDTQNIRSNGLDSAVFSLIAKTSETEHQLSVRSVATLGPEFDEAALKQEVAGKKRGDVEKLLENREGVRSVSVEFSPFWIFEVPDKPDKITILINEL